MGYGTYHFLHAMHHYRHLAIHYAVLGADAEGIHVEVEPVGYLRCEVHEQAVPVHTGYGQCDGIGETDAVYGYGGGGVDLDGRRVGIVGIVDAYHIVAELAGHAYGLGT